MKLGRVFSIERYAVHDGHGIRTLVYLQGCPLRCLWCANPEGQEERSLLFVHPERCIGCGRCLAACPTGVARMAPGGPPGHDPAGCVGCGVCTDACGAGARRLVGRAMAVDEVLAEVARDAAFYRESGGGVTLGGGEPTAQPEFAGELLRECRRRGLHTALETCGHVPWRQLGALVEDLDLILFDIKHMDPHEHRRLTGVGNETILENLRRLAKRRSPPVVVRVPVVPEHNDSPAHMGELAEFLAGLAGLEGVDLLPYHGYGREKYARCGRDYPLGDLPIPPRDHLHRLAAVLRSRGVACRVL